MHRKTQNARFEVGNCNKSKFIYLAQMKSGNVLIKIKKHSNISHRHISDNIILIIVLNQLIKPNTLGKVFSNISLTAIKVHAPKQ